MKHDMKVEERYFSEDINSLKAYDEGFGTAYDNGGSYELTIRLTKLFEICPRKNQNKQMYERFVAFLYEKGIVMNIESRKKNKKNLIDDDKS